MHLNTIGSFCFVVPKLPAGSWVGWPRCQRAGLTKMKHSLHPFIIEASNTGLVFVFHLYFTVLHDAKFICQFTPFSFF